MKLLTFWYDVVSPYAYLAFERLPQALDGISYEVEYRPVLFAGLLGHWGHKGPAESDPKRAWIFRQCHWLAARHGIVLDTPAVHPFNPLPLLRLALAAGSNRRVTEAVMRHTWQGGADAVDPVRLSLLQAELRSDGVATLEPGSDEVKRALRRHGEEAVSRGVFGVPSIEVDGRLFWGLDALEMLAASLRGDPWFDGPSWAREGLRRPGVHRRLDG